MKLKKHDFDVGDGASICIGSDSRPATVIKITPTRITVQEDFYRNTNGENFMSGNPTFEYTPNPEGPVECLSFAQNLNDWIKGTRPAARMLNSQIILADFGYAFTKRTRNRIDQEIADWMMDNVSSFKLITDESTPFCDAMAEFCFTCSICYS